MLLNVFIDGSEWCWHRSLWKNDCRVDSPVASASFIDKGVSFHNFSENTWNKPLFLVMRYPAPVLLQSSYPGQSRSTLYLWLISSKSKGATQILVRFQMQNHGDSFGYNDDDDRDEHSMKI